MKLYLQSIKVPDRRFEILSYDPATKLGQVKSPTYGSTWTEDLSKETLSKLGYRVEKSDDAA